MTTEINRTLKLFKTINVLNTTYTQISLGQHNVPPPLKNLHHHQQTLNEELQHLHQKQTTNLDHHEHITTLEQESTNNQATIRELETR